MIQIAICDDEVEMCREIENQIRTIETGEKILRIYIYLSGEELLKSIEEGKNYQIIFLDYEMDGMNGRETGIALRELFKKRECLLVYVSSHENMILKLLDAEIFHFIKKPIEPETFNHVFRKACSRVTESEDLFWIKKKRDYIPIKKNKIYYLESEGRQVKLKTEDGSYTMYHQLDAVAEEFLYPGSSFIRIHKSYLINFDYCTEVSAKTVIMEDNRELDISKPYRNAFKFACMNFMRRG